ncbi:copper amine oxidase N-terminal domain-containing protein [Paenibacillus segetis]|uniref:Copper amine oxidase-like N-terminal domain-containing protein n=1 Tax=Paenibacillus segetis TaxID=1325360 RepID=A0ABQ1Y5K9_9BACL|nr:copper amine oxidase N-terminal domain-containing protein [Paenibacillus segetis]GGH13553.1 hypothetical protein GCM10008013_06690 [Paenibacillus segetis]
MMKKSKWIAAPLILLLIMLTGCTAIGGFDVNKAILGSFDVKASESKQTLSFEIVPAAGGNLSAEEKKAIELINSLSLTVDNAKVKDGSNVSIVGSVGYQGKKLPFQLAMDEKGMTVQVEGAKKPIYIALDTSEQGLPDMTQYKDQVQDLSIQAMGLIIKHLPNPSTLSVKQLQEKVNGESLNLTNLHVELGGDELLGLIKPFLTNLSKDEQGLKEIIGAFYDVSNTLGSMYTDPFEYEYEDEYDYDYEDEYDVEETTPLLSSKEVEVAAIFGVIQQGITELLTNYDEQVTALLDETPELKTVLSKDTTLKVDLYFDSALNIRKQVLDLKVALPQSEELPIQAIKVHSENETWNIGGVVVPDKVDISAGVLDVTDGVVTPGQILRNFETNSEVYKLLKNDLKISQKYLVIDTLSDYDGVITKNNTSFVPLRYLSEQLDAEVKWTKGSKQIVIIDDITGLNIVITVGSKEAKIGDRTVTLAQPAFVDKSGTTYVPLRFMAESLGAVVQSDPDGWITIERQ